MKTTTKLICIAVFTFCVSVVFGQTSSTVAVSKPPTERPKIEGRYFGTWVTTNRKLDGTMNCEVKQLANDRWQGRFWGVWQQVPFDYSVEFAADKSKKPLPELATARRAKNVVLVDHTSANRVTGKATIDGAHYDWIGNLTPNEFTIQFTGSRYEGYAVLTRPKEKTVLR